MTDQISTLSIPPEWEDRYFLKRIGEEDIEISNEQRILIIKSLNDGKRFIQLGKYTLMLNTIKSIDPRYEPHNIPPKPREPERLYYWTQKVVEEDGRYIKKNIFMENQYNDAVKEYKLWCELFDKKPTEHKETKKIIGR